MEKQSRKKEVIETKNRTTQPKPKSQNKSSSKSKNNTTLISKTQGTFLKRMQQDISFKQNRGDIYEKLNQEKRVKTSPARQREIFNRLHQDATRRSNSRNKLQQFGILIEK